MSIERSPRPPAAGVAPRDRARREGGVGRRPSRFWRIREDIPTRLRLALIVTSLVAPIALWTLLVVTNAVSDNILPSPLAVAQAMRELISEGLIQGDAWASVRRISIGFGISVLIAVPLGLAMGTFKSMEALFEPAIGFIRYMPATAFVILMIFWLGLEESPKITLIVIGTVFFNTLMIANVVWQVPTELIKVAFTLGAGNFTVLRRVIFPHTLPGMIDAMRVNLAAAWNLIVVAELVAADQGLGFRIVRAQRTLAVDEIFAVLIVIGVLGFASDYALRTLRNRLSPWSQE
jgi:NitT/TauT family transport system permease protein